MLIINNKGFLLPTCKGTEYIIAANIIRIEAISNYSKLYFSNGKTLVVAKVLRWFEEKLGQQGFIRTHRTHLVNGAYIHNYNCQDKGSIRLQNGELLQLAKRKKSLFIKTWSQYMAA